MRRFIPWVFLVLLIVVMLVLVWPMLRLPFSDATGTWAVRTLLPLVQQQPTAVTEMTPTVTPTLVPESTETATVTPTSTSTDIPTHTPTMVATATPTPMKSPWPQIALKPFASGLSSPVAIVNAGDGSGRLFVLEQDGRIRIVEKDGTVLPVPFLDISDRVSCCGERGLLGLAFPPDYATKGHFYIDYTDTAGNTVVARYLLTSDQNVADPNSEQIVLTIDQPYANHNGGNLVFGPDGYLYIGMGDGGSQGDPQNRGQNPSVLLGKLLRIDVETGNPATYTVPASNPFVHTPGYRPEIWAWGLRNPWRFSFDRQTGDLYIGDVGQNLWEEVDFQPAGSPGGQNYGWRIMEGMHCYGATTCDTQGLVLPVAEYNHSLGCAIVGGFVYRGVQYPEMQGTYFYADYCSGRIWGLRHTEATWESAELYHAPFTVSAFGQDEADELYLADYGGGIIYQVIAQR